MNTFMNKFLVIKALALTATMAQASSPKAARSLKVR
jgi:hypothetical protein